MHDDPIAYFLTWVSYGTWLPGDIRGWVEYRHGWQPADTIRKLEAKARMTEEVCILTPSQRRAVEAQIAETSRIADGSFTRSIVAPIMYTLY